MAARKKATGKKEARKKTSRRVESDDAPEDKWPLPIPGEEKLLKSWSYSAWGDYDSCPRKSYYKKILRVPDESGAAAIRGTKIHAVAEEYVKGEIDELPLRGPGKELRAFTKELDHFRGSPSAKAEEDFAFTNVWQPTQWNNWAACWVRMKVDVLDFLDNKTLRIVDYKSGQMRDYELQLELYALGGFKRHPGVKRVVAEIFYVDHEEIEGLEFEKSEEEDLQEQWEERVDPMLNDRTYPATPSDNACRWCPAHAKKGGPCKVGA